MKTWMPGDFILVDKIRVKTETSEIDEPTTIRPITSSTTTTSTSTTTQTTTTDDNFTLELETTSEGCNNGTEDDLDDDTTYWSSTTLRTSRGSILFTGCLNYLVFLFMTLHHCYI